MRKIILTAAFVCLNLVSTAFADEKDMIVHNLINSASNASYDSHWGNQIPAWQLGKINWQVVSMGCEGNSPCVLNIFSDVNSANPKYVGDVTVDLDSHEITSVSNAGTLYRLCKGTEDSTEVFLVRSSGAEFQKYC